MSKFKAAEALCFFFYEFSDNCDFTDGEVEIMMIIIRFIIIHHYSLVEIMMKRRMEKKI
jgi:hypothetical protein